MNENNELNDIILNKGGATNSNKKIVLAIATLGVILVIVVMLMNSLSSSGTSNLPQAVIPPQPQTQTTDNVANEPLFKEVEIVQESSSDADLDMIAQKLKQETFEEEKVFSEPVAVVKEEKIVKQEVLKKKAAPKVQQPIKKALSTVAYYVQVGSFSKYKPNKKFLDSIENLGYRYEFHKVKNLNKVLVGPFSAQKNAKKARSVLRSKVEPGAFLIKL